MNLEDLKKAFTCSVEPLEINGTTVYLKQISTRDRDGWLVKAQEYQKNPKHAQNFQAELLQKVLCDANGELIADDLKGRNTILDMPSGITSEMFDKAMEMNFPNIKDEAGN